METAPHTAGRRIAIDVTAATRREPSGVARTIHALLGGLAAVAAPEDRFVLEARLSRWKDRAHRPGAPDERFRSRWMQGAWHARGVDVAHGPDARVLDAGRAARVVTVHDLFALEDDAEGTPAWREKMRRRYADVARRADLVLCPSTWTRERFCTHHPAFDADRARVIPHGVEARFAPDAVERVPDLRRRLRLDGDYALFLGALVRRKNPDVLLEAWARLPSGAPTLVLAGPSAGRRPLLEERATELGIGDRVHFAGFVGTADVPPLLAGARCLLLPSRREGFGLPVLEAQACGTPVVHSGHAALEEATGAHRVVVDAGDVESIVAGVERVLTDGALRERLRTGGLAHAARLTWARCATRTWKAYQDAASMSQAASRAR